jgi:hypothetical protein
VYIRTWGLLGAKTQQQLLALLGSFTTSAAAAVDTVCCNQGTSQFIAYKLAESEHCNPFAMLCCNQGYSVIV